MNERVEYTAPCPACGHACTFTAIRAVDSNAARVEVDCPCEETSH